MEQNKNNTALLVLDMQVGIFPMLPNAPELVGNVARAIANARAKQIPVIYVTVGFRQGAPEVSMNNKSFSSGKDRFAKVDMAEFMRVLPELAPQPGEVIVAKRRVSAFTERPGSDFEGLWHNAPGAHRHCYKRRGTVNSA